MVTTERAAHRGNDSRMPAMTRSGPLFAALVQDRTVTFTLCVSEPLTVEGHSCDLAGVVRRRAVRPRRGNSRYPYTGTVGGQGKIIASVNGGMDLPEPDQVR